MKKEKLKGFICGVLMSTLIFSSGVIGFASIGSKQITAAYNNIKIYVNNKLVSPKDANGNTVEPFIYNGTTYLPVRAVGDALGQAVSWDNNTKSVYIGEQPSQTVKTPTATLGEQNALKEAKEYLEYSAFSYEGLIKQLEFEGYSEAEAKYGVDNCGADWFVQAEREAKEYLEYSAFSRSGLIEQLEFEGYTHEQAVHGVESVGY